MIQKKNIWIICEYNQFDTPEVLQLLQKANELKKQINSEVWVICIGKYQKEAFNVLQEYGATDVLHEAMESFDFEAYIYVLEQIMTTYEPQLLIFTDSQESKIIASKLSNRFEIGLTVDCIDVQIDKEDEYVFSRTAMNDSVLANIKCVESKYQMCTVKSNIFQIQKMSNTKELHIHRLQNKAEFKYQGKCKAYVECKQKNNSSTRDIYKAKVVIAVGRGIGDKDTFKLIKKVSSYWGAEIVGTRVAVEEGWVDSTRQVGQSGISIAPALYISFGVSGTMQHMIGLKNAKTIVAINKDPTAPIFNYADYCIVEDLNKVLQEMNKYI